MTATLFSMTAHVQNDALTFTLFETEPGTVSNSVEVVFDVTSQRIVLFESEAALEISSLKRILKSLLVLLPQVRLMTKKFLKNYLSERIQTNSHN